MAIAYEAEHIHSFELRLPDGGALPAFSAGAHIDVHLPHRRTRSYALINPQGETHRYVIAVALDGDSRGGSRFIHEALRAGDMLSISPPASDFPLVESAAHSVFVAGGIGIAPILCMVERLASLGRAFTLYHRAPNPRAAAFREHLQALCAQSGNALHLSYDDAPEAKMAGIESIVAAAPVDAHVYCCGPNGMLGEFERATERRPRDQVHVEYFSPKVEPAAARAGFTVVLAKSNRQVFVADGCTILDALIDAGFEPAYSCMGGVCGTCETRVLEGVPEHRDIVLSEAEKAENKTMMICCSVAKTPTLVLDL
jgi:vanillate O-demethylase ferredoxin subunit